MEEAKIEGLAEQEKNSKEENAKEEVNETRGAEKQDEKQEETSQAHQEEKLPESPNKIENVAAEKGESEKENAKAKEFLVKIEDVEKRLGELEKKLTQIEENFGGLKSTVEELKAMLKSASDFAGAMLETAFKEKFSSIAREIEKLNEKITMLIDEVGAGEGLNVAKIPPTILEIVYQSTLDDVVNAMFRQLGSAEAERAIAETLEEIRERTSGSELFRFDGKRIRTKEVAKSIERRLVSAKQMQTTYDELLKRLLEHIPGYKPKNFRAMIKLKSQEYSVDSTIHLTERLAELEKWCSRIDALISMADKREAEILENMQAIADSLKDLRAEAEEKRALLHTKIEEEAERIARLEGNFEGTWGEIKEQITDLAERIEVLEKKAGIVREAKEAQEEKIAGEKAELSSDESFLYYAVENERRLSDLKSTLSLMFSDEKIEELVESLVGKGYLEKFEKEGEVYLRKKNLEDRGVPSGTPHEGTVGGASPSEKNEEVRGVPPGTPLGGTVGGRRPLGGYRKGAQAPSGDAESIPLGVTVRGASPSLDEQILHTMEDGFTFRKLQNKFKGVDKETLLATLEKLINEGKIYVEGTERRKIYRISSPSMDTEKDGGV